MVKPCIDPLDDTWRALIQPTGWPAWFTSYRAFILHYAELAQQEGVEQFSVGVEYTSAERYEAEWRSPSRPTTA